jgi:hypothetical protein
MPKKKNNIYKYSPNRIGDSDRYWCIVCKKDYGANHLHFQMTTQTKLSWATYD